MTGKFERSFSLRAVDAIKSIKEVFHGIAVGQTVEERFDWNARPEKAWRSADSVAIDTDDSKQRMPGLNLVADQVFGGDLLQVLDDGERMDRKHVWPSCEPLYQRDIRGANFQGRHWQCNGKKRDGGSSLSKWYSAVGCAGVLNSHRPPARR